MLGGDVAYLCLAIPLALIKDVSSQGKIRLASVRMKIFQNPFRSLETKPSPDQPVPSALPAFRRGDVFRTKNKRLAKLSARQCRSGGGEKPYALAD